MKTLITNYIDYLIAMLLAGAGGAIRMLANHKEGEKRSFFMVISDTKIIVVAISGYAAREVIELLRGFATGAIGALLQRKKDGGTKSK